MRPGAPFLHVPRCTACDGTGFEAVDRDCLACGGTGITKRSANEVAIERVLRNRVAVAVWHVYLAYLREFFSEGYKPTDFLDYVCVTLKDEFGFDDPNEVYEHRLKERRSFSRRTRHTKDQLDVCRCDVCGKEEMGSYVPHGWWGYPAGWLLSDSEATGSVLVCSPECARAFEDKS